jgi:hypothetical protein
MDAGISARRRMAQETISRIYATKMKKSSEFNEARYAILFKPGHYNLDVRVGYYTQIAGLGRTPDDVTLVGFSTDLQKILVAPGPSHLLELGETGSCGDHRSNPTVLYDVFCRVGGSSHIGRATTCGDNLCNYQ